jgi:hypothetical protein
VAAESRVMESLGSYGVPITRSMACSKSLQTRGSGASLASADAKRNRLAALEMASRSAGAKPSILSTKINDEPRSLARETSPATCSAESSMYRPRPPARVAA